MQRRYTAKLLVTCLLLTIMSFFMLLDPKPYCCACGLTNLSIRQMNVPKRSYDMKQQPNSTSCYHQINSDIVNLQKYSFNCTNINQIKIIQKEIGGGRSKSVNIGIFNGRKLVIKRISKVKQPLIGHQYRELLFLKEILIRDQLYHPNLIKMLGICVRSIGDDNYEGLKKVGDILAVFEYGKEFNVSMLNLTVEERLNHALELLDLLMYLHNSPLGSLVIGDFNRNHFLMVGNKIKLIDLDYMHNIEPPCGFTAGNNHFKCPYNISCTIRENDSRTRNICNNQTSCKVGACVGANMKFNIASMYDAFLRHFLSEEYYSESVQKAVVGLSRKLAENSIGIERLVKDLRQIVILYKHQVLK